MGCKQQIKVSYKGFHWLVKVNPRTNGNPWCGDTFYLRVYVRAQWRRTFQFWDKIYSGIHNYIEGIPVDVESIMDGYLLELEESVRVSKLHGDDLVKFTNAKKL